MSVKHPSNTWVRRLYTIALIAMAAISVCYIGQVMWYMATSPNKMTVEVISSTAEPAVETNITTPPTEVVVEKLVEQTNGLVRVHDVGGTVSFQSTSSKTSAPVAPENPYLKK